MPTIPPNNINFNIKPKEEMFIPMKTQMTNTIKHIINQSFISSVIKLLISSLADLYNSCNSLVSKSLLAISCYLRYNILSTKNHLLAFLHNLPVYRRMLKRILFYYLLMFSSYFVGKCSHSIYLLTSLFSLNRGSKSQLINQSFFRNPQQKVFSPLFRISTIVSAQSYPCGRQNGIGNRRIVDRVFQSLENYKQRLINSSFSPLAGFRPVTRSIKSLNLMASNGGLRVRQPFPSVKTKNLIDRGGRITPSTALDKVLELWPLSVSNLLTGSIIHP